MATATLTDDAISTNGHSDEPDVPGAGEADAEKGALDAAPDAVGGYEEEARRALREHLEETGRSMSAAARGMGRSASALSQFLSGSYRGDNTAVAHDARSYLRRERERDRRRREGSLLTGVCVETEGYRRLHQIARLCHVERDVGVVCAEAGSGKTVAAEAYAEEHSGVIFIEVDPGFTAKATMIEVCRALGVEERGTLYALTRRVYERLRGSGRLLIIDEAESLPTRALELLRRIYDRTGCGLLLVGLERLLHNLQGSEREFKQLWSRVGVKAALPADLSEEDTRALVDATLPADCDTEAVTEAVRAATCGARPTAKLLRRAASVAQMNGREVTPAIVKKAKQLLIL